MDVPLPENPFLTGREELFEKIEQTLHDRGAVALSGLAGVGKTEAVANYAHAHRGDYSAVLWAGADSSEAIIADFARIAALLDLPEKNASEQDLVIDGVQRWLRGNRDWLLVLDNSADLGKAANYVPQVAKGHVVFTSQAQATGTIVRLEVSLLPAEKGAQFLLRRGKLLDAHSADDPAHDANFSLAQSISTEMAGLPLALDQAAAYIEETGCSLGAYLDLYRERSGVLLKRRGSTQSGHPDSVATTFSLSFQQVEAANPIAADLLRLCAFLHAERIPEEIVARGASTLRTFLSQTADDDLKLNDALAECLKYSLLRRDGNNRTYSIHRLIQIVIAEGMDNAQRCEWAENTVRATGEVFPEVWLEYWGECDRLLLHALACETLIAQRSFTFLEAAALLNKTAAYLKERTRLAEAERLCKRGLAIREQTMGTEDPLVAKSLDTLARIYRAQGRYAEGEALCRRALRICQVRLGKEHEDTADMLNDLGVLLIMQGRPADAEEILLAALAIRERLFGNQDRRVASTLNNLAGIYGARMGHEEAEPLAIRALEIGEAVLEPEDPTLATYINNLGALYHKMSRLDEAELLIVRSGEMCLKSLGPNHPRVASYYNNLGTLYGEQGNSPARKLLSGAPSQYMKVA